LAGLAVNEQEDFSWDIDQVRQLLGGPGGNHPQASLEAELPFRVQLECYYLINPADDSDDPFWIGRCCGVGTIICSCPIICVGVCTYMTSNSYRNHGRR
jgi:hypothetical protein